MNEAETRAEYIDPKDYKQYSNWGEVGERIMERFAEFLDK